MKDSLTTYITSLPEYNSPSTSRLQSLYSDISRQKAINPTNFESSVEWWRRTLDGLVTKGLQSPPDVLVLHATAQLTDAFRYEKVGKPLSLATVVAELSSSRKLIRIDEFMRATQSIYTTSSLPMRVASYLIGRPLWWALEQLNIVGSDAGPSNWQTVKGDYVLVSALERAADAVVEHQRHKAKLSVSESLHDRDSFRAEFAKSALPGVVLSNLDIKVLIKYLERDRQVLVTEKEILKFVDPDTEGPHTITVADRGILEIKTTAQRLQEQIDEIQRKIEDRTAKITEYLRQKRKEMAMSYLRSRKQLEELLTRRVQSLETIHTALLKIEGAAGDIEIMKAYETSAKTLRTMLAHPSLQREHVDATMESLADALADHAEIEEAIKLGGDGARAAAGLEEPDEKELEAELEMLIKEKELEENAEKARVEMERRNQEEPAVKEEKEKEREKAMLAQELEAKQEERLAAHHEVQEQPRLRGEEEKTDRARWREEVRAKEPQLAE